jgi:hypothetical protein
MVKKIPQQVLKGLGEIARETGAEVLREAGKLGGLVDEEKKQIGDGEENFDSVLGKVSKINPELLEKYKEKEDQKSQKEVKRLQSQIKRPFRDVEEEMERVREEKDKKEEEEEQFLEQIKKQREEEEREGEEILEIPEGKKARGTAFLRGSKKAVGTGEMSKNKD